jgi:hypothetical protein
MFGPFTGAPTATQHNVATQQVNKAKICFEFIEEVLLIGNLISSCRGDRVFTRSF